MSIYVKPLDSSFGWSDTIGASALYVETTTCFKHRLLAMECQQPRIDGASGWLLLP